MNISRTVSRAATAAALAAALSVGAIQSAASASPVERAGTARTVNAPASTPVFAPVFKAPLDDGGWTGDGLSLNAADNAKVDAFIDRAKKAERSISPQVRTAALISGAKLIGFDHRLKSADSLKRKVATSLLEHPERNVNDALAGINDSVRYTLQWPDGRYTEGVALAASVLSEWGNDNTKWSNTWGRAKGYKAINSGWRAPRSEHLFEVQFHTPASKHAQEVTHKLYEEQRLPGTSPERAKELQAQQDALFAAVPVPPGADGLTAPAPRVPRLPQPSLRPQPVG
ncbi:ATP nucleotide 3'-pyrophosphokinase [Streptomyces melanogenes]|uniref:ATP nucleotide 3'-pyrophosphokinase n=1 Tax=Streptomyces melanogenes TaxID=67326 RepID=A0ABZ1XET5_9ACTN|nr:ATP nucleotide 3'-pyrophosphokinase [Streptomyces melanogenes]